VYELLGVHGCGRGSSPVTQTKITDTLSGVSVIFICVTKFESPPLQASFLLLIYVIFNVRIELLFQIINSHITFMYLEK